MAPIVGNPLFASLPHTPFCSSPNVQLCTCSPHGQMVTELSSPVGGAHSLSLRSLSLRAGWKNKINRQYFLVDFSSLLSTPLFSLSLPVYSGSSSCSSRPPFSGKKNKAWRKKNLDVIQSNNSTFSVVSSLMQVAVLTWSHPNFLFPVCSQYFVPNFPSPLTFTP